MKKHLQYSFLLVALIFTAKLYSQDTVNAKKANELSFYSQSVNNASEQTEEIEVSAYPNPFSSVVNLQFSLDKDAKVILEVYNILGRKVKTIHNSILEEGDYSFRWDGASFDNGIYLYKFDVNGEVQTGRLILRK